MFEKYNEKARRALFFARYEASKLGSRVIESEHILLGVLREGEGPLTELLARLSVRPDEIRKAIEGDRVLVERISSTAELPLSEESKKILAYARMTKIGKTIFKKAKCSYCFFYTDILS